ncbi:MAG TPA: hypothetical protein VG410_15030 [Solirubrobacteraceae bacterium]|jgi:hypothetical protein|nr:hypothetical protein [Solirubrobacteraceae bacterium]
MTGDSQLILLMIAGVHLLGLGCVAVLMVTALRTDPNDPPHSANSDGDDGRGNKPRRPRAPSGRPRGGIPLPDAEPAGVRLRDHTKLGDHLPHRERRPAREPDRRPVRAS